MNKKMTKVRHAATFAVLSNCRCGGNLKTEEERNFEIQKTVFGLICSRCGKRSSKKTLNDSDPIAMYHAAVNLLANKLEGA